MNQNERKSATTRRSFLKTGLAGAASLFFLPKRAFAAYESAAEEASNDVVLRCCVMSDVHITSAEDCASVERLTRSIDFMYDYSATQPYKKFDAFVGVGDLSNSGRHEEVRRFKATLDAAIRPGTREIICMGNHEFIQGTVEFWREVYGVEPNARYDVNGYQFIMVGMETGMKEEGDYLYALDWLEKELDAASKATPDKPIFVCQHYPVRETIYGSRGHDVWAASDMYELLQKYPKIVDFSGHTHLPINDPRCAWQGNFTAFGTGTLANLWHGGEGGILPERLPDDAQNAQFYIMEVRRDNSVTLKLYDVMTNSFFDGVYVVAEPGNVEKYVYTDARAERSALPKWSEDAKVDVHADDLIPWIEVPQATCPDVTIAYRVDLESKDSDGKWNDAGKTYFYSQYFKRNMPEKARGNFDGLEGLTEYRGKVYALNAFMKPSEQFLPIAFKTIQFPGEPDDKDAPCPRANFLDLRVVDGKVVNAASDERFTSGAVETIGEPKIVAESELGGANVVELDGGSCYKVRFDKGEYAFLRRFTIETKVRLDAAKTKPWECLLSNTEGTGVSLCIGPKGETIELWASVDGGYRILTTPIVFGKYVDVCGTYDGKKTTLYVDGKEVASETAGGALKCPEDSNVQAFCYGADIAPGGSTSSLLHGRLARGRVYSWALTAKQVAAVAAE